MKRIHQFIAAVFCIGALLAGSLVGGGAAFAQARATTTTGVVTLRQIISGSLTFAGSTGMTLTNGIICWASKSCIDGHTTDGNILLSNNAGTSFSMLQFGGTSASFPGLKSNGGSELAVRTASDSTDGNFRAGDFFTNSGSITNGSGTGITVNTGGAVRNSIYKVTVLSTNFIANATTADVTLGTLPAKTIIQGLFADLTTTFACASTCTTSTLSMTCGKTAGGAEYLVSFDADAAAAQFGLTQATTGTALKQATPPVTAIGDLPSWSGTTAVQCRLTSGTGAVGTGAATNLSQGSVTFYLVTVRLP